MRDEGHSVLGAGRLSRRAAAIGMAAVLSVFLALGQVASAQVALPERRAPETRTEVTLSFAPIVKKTASSVVNVYGTRRETRGRSAVFDDPIFREFFGGGPVQERVRQSVGSGVIVSPEGIVVTNHHVIEGMTEVKVALADKRELEAEIILRDPRTDLAVLKLKGAEKLTAIELGDSDGLEVGDIVLAIGNPFGVGQTVTQGIVSALARTQVGVSDYQFFIQTDAAINPGNSGGALVDMQGRLVGINTAIFSRSGGNQGIGFAIPRQYAQAGGAERSKWREYRRPPLVWRSPPGSHDRYGGGAWPVASCGRARRLRRRQGAGSGCRNQAWRRHHGGRWHRGRRSGGIRLSLCHEGYQRAGAADHRARRQQADRQHIAESFPRGSGARSDRAQRQNAVFRNVDREHLPRTAEELSVTTDSPGVVISNVEPGTISEQLGFQKGDIVLNINNEPVETTRDMERVLSKSRSAYWRVTINRGGQVINTVFGG